MTLGFEGALVFAIKSSKQDDLLMLPPKELGEIVRACEDMENPFDILNEDELKLAEAYTKKWE